MILRLLLIFSAIFGASLGAVARDLPIGEFVVFGALEDSLAAKKIDPTFVHLRVDSAGFDWTFSSPVAAKGWLCEDFKLCHQHVYAISHELRWAGDGALEVLGSTRVPDVAIRWPENDGPYILDPIDALMEGARLELAVSGGVLTRKDGRALRLVPSSLRNLEDAMALVTTTVDDFDAINPCATESILGFMADARVGMEAETVLAARNAGRMHRLTGEATYYDDDKVPPDQQADLVAKAVKLKALEAIFSGAVLVVKEVRETKNSRVSDAALRLIIGQFLRQIKPKLGAEFEAVKGALKEPALTEFIAGIRYQARVELVKGSKEISMEEALCKDVTLDLDRLREGASSLD